MREELSQITLPISSQADDPAHPGVTISIGVVALHDSRRDLNGLLVAADHALYEAKEAGRNMVRPRPKARLELVQSHEAKGADVTGRARSGEVRLTPAIQAVLLLKTPRLRSALK